MERTTSTASSGPATKEQRMGGNWTGMSYPNSSMYYAYQVRAAIRPTFGEVNGPNSGAITNSSRNYKPIHKNGEKGAIPGKHTVSISTDKDGSGANETVPEKYNKNTTLSAEVKAGENPPINFDL